MGSGVFMKKSEMISYLGLTECEDCQVALRRILSNNFDVREGDEIELPEWACKALLSMVEEEKPVFEGSLSDKRVLYDQLEKWRKGVGL